METSWKWIVLCLGIVFIWNYLDLDIAPSPKKEISEQPVKIIGSIRKSILPEEYLRTQVANSLQNYDVDGAITALSALPDGAVKREECEHVFSFFLHHYKLDNAKNVAIHCWNGKMREEAFTQIELQG